MLPDERRIADEILADAVGSTTSTSSQIDAAMAGIDDLAGSGVEWVQDWQRSLMRQGVAKELGRWRSRHRKAAKTRKGSEVDAPEYGGVRRANGDGKDEYHQLHFADMTLDEMEAWVRDRRKARDTVSREIQWANDVIEVAREIRADRMGPAITELERRHA